jgi:hypothetical protein
VTHSLGSAPDSYNVNAVSEDASTDFWVDNVSSNSLDINYATAPASGTDNLEWEVTTFENGALAGTQDTHTDVSDGGSLVVGNVDDINFDSNLTVTDDNDGTVTVDASSSDSRTNVSDDGSQVVTDTTDINAGDGLDVTDDGDGSVTIDKHSVSADELVASPNGTPPNATLDDTETVEITVPVPDSSTLEVFLWGAYKVSDGTAPTGLDVELLDGSDTAQASENTTRTASTDENSPVASYTNSSGSQSIFKLRALNGTGSAISDPGVGAIFGYRVV